MYYSVFILYICLGMTTIVLLQILQGIMAKEYRWNNESIVMITDWCEFGIIAV